MVNAVTRRYLLLASMGVGSLPAILVKEGLLALIAELDFLVGLL